MTRMFTLGAVLFLASSCVPEIGPEVPELATQARSATYDHVPVPERELGITDVSVVDDPDYTGWRDDRFNTDAAGAWSFGRLMANLSPREKPTAAELSDFVTRWLKLWERDQEINGFVAPARP